MKSAVEVDILTRILSTNPPVDTIMAVLSSLSTTIGQELEIDHLCRESRAMIEGLLVDDRRDAYPRVMALVLLSLSRLSSIPNPTAEVSRQVCVQWWTWVEFMVDYPDTVNRGVAVVNRLEGIAENTEFRAGTLENTNRYTRGEFFHPRIGARIFENIEDNTNEETLRKIKDLLGIFANMITFVMKKGASEDDRKKVLLVLRNLKDLLSHPLPMHSRDAYLHCIRHSAKETLKRCNMLYVYIIDTMHYLQNEIRLFGEIEVEIGEFCRKVVEERRTTYESFSDCSIMRILLDYFTRTKEKEELYKFLQPRDEFQVLLQNLLWSKDSEDLKYSFHFLQECAALVKDKDERHVWVECIGLLSTLDSYGRHLVEPQWQSVSKSLLAYLEKKDFNKRTNLDLFWMFQILATKAMTHENPFIVKSITSHILENDLNLNVYWSLVSDSLIPYLDNGKLYEDVGMDVDVHPKMATYLRTFFLKNGKQYSETITKNFESFCRRIVAIEAFNAKAAVWHIFGGLYEAKIKCETFSNELLEQMVVRALEVAQNYPPYRKSLFADDFVSFLGCLKLDVVKWKILSKFFLAESLQEVYFHHTMKPTREKHMAVLTADPSTFEDIVIELECFSADLFKRMVQFTPVNLIYFWNIKLFLMEGQKYEVQSPSKKVSIATIKENLIRNIPEVFSELDRQTNNPYVNKQEFSSLAIASMKALFEAVGSLREETIIPKKSDIPLKIVSSLTICAEDNFDQKENIDILLYELRNYMNTFKKEEGTALEITINKGLRVALASLSKFLSQPYTKGDDAQELNNTYKVDVLLQISTHLLSWLIEDDARVIENETKLLMEAVYSQLTTTPIKSGGGVRITPLLRATFCLYHEYIFRDILVKEEKLNDYIDDCPHLTVINKTSRVALNKIFSKMLLPHLKVGDSLTDKFFKNTLDTISRNRNSFLSYYVFESFLLVALENQPEDVVKMMCDKLVEVCEIENSAFRLRKVATVACKFILNYPKRISQAKNLIYYLITKEETRPRDTTLLVDIREFVYDNGMFEELTKEITMLNSYNAFPRILVCCALERVFNKFGDYDPETQDSLDLFVEQLYENFFFSYFKEGNTRSLKPYDERHRALLRRFQCMITLSNYMKNSKLC